MAKKKRRSFPPVEEPKKQPKNTSSMPESRTRWELVALFLIIAIGGTYVAVWMKPVNTIPEFGYKVVKTYPHDKEAFTQGLLFHDGYLYESTGLTEKSSLRKVDLESGEVLKRLDLSDDLFGEGLTRFDDRLIQLTWKNETGIVYRETEDGFEEIKRFPVDHQGWGITDDGSSLIVSDGTARLRFLDPDTFEQTRELFVRRKDRRVLGQLNELEHFGSKIYANLYMSDKIYRIDDTTGDVEAIIDLSGLWPISERPDNQAVINGIAIKPDAKGKMWVTGKLCPYVYEIEIVPK